MKTPPTVEEQAELRELAGSVKGFSLTHFEFQARHTEDRGIGNIADFVEIDDRLVAIEPDVDEPYVISYGIEKHIAEGLAVYLNAAGPLARAVVTLLDALDVAERECAGLREALIEATRDTVTPRLNALAEKLTELGEETFAAKNARIAVLEAELATAKEATDTSLFEAASLAAVNIQAEADLTAERAAHAETRETRTKAANELRHALLHWKAQAEAFAKVTMFARHTDLCTIFQTGSDDCSCGLDEARKAAGL